MVAIAAAKSGQPAAARAGGFAGVWLDVPPGTLRARVAARRGGVSDATAEVLEAQLARGTGEVSWTRVDGTEASADLVAEVCSRS
ncbi:hypothetical protein [Mangrovicoccus ximenensis]|uniref:hypothetical protein n=1 Tax=Mangrovicoccus ximenensis TaxID=1911570 RepID=UPI000D3CC2B4|nr:hypothetical protein [Mangrovicoccus ximenensis]